MAKERIEHEGRVIAVDKDYISVEIVNKSACAACHAKGLCSLGDSKVKQVEVPTRGWDNYTVGQEVSVVLRATMGHKAVWLAYGVPLLVLVAALLGILSAGGSELVAGLGAIGAVAVYYGVIWLLRDRLRKEYVFNIK